MKNKPLIATLFIASLLLATSTALAQPQPTESKIAPNAAELMARARAENMRANQPMGNIRTDQAKPYTIVGHTGKGQRPGMLWIVAPTVSSHTERAHTLLKAAEDFHADNPVSPIHVHMPLIAHYETSLHQAIGTYNAEKRTWRALAYDGPAIPEWKITVTKAWYDLLDDQGKLILPENEAKDTIGRAYNISPTHIEPLYPLKLTPYIPN